MLLRFEFVKILNCSSMYNKNTVLLLLPPCPYTYEMLMCNRNQLPPPLFFLTRLKDRIIFDYLFHSYGTIHLKICIYINHLKPSGFVLKRKSVKYKRHLTLFSNHITSRWCFFYCVRYNNIACPFKRENQHLSLGSDKYRKNLLKSALS